MDISPDFAGFEQGWTQGRNQLLTLRLAADLDTPVSLMLKLAEAAPNSFMLESVTGGEVRGRYSIIGMKPDLIWECRAGRARINREARYSDIFTDDARPALDSLRALIGESRIEMPDGVPAAAAGLFGYLGYDMIRLVEDLPNVNPDPIGVPDAMLTRPSVVAVLDGVKGEVTLCAPVWHDPAMPARAAYAQAAERLTEAVTALRGLADVRTPTVITFFGYWLCAAPAAWMLGFPLGFPASPLCCINVVAPHTLGGRVDTVFNIQRSATNGFKGSGDAVNVVARHWVFQGGKCQLRNGCNA